MQLTITPTFTGSSTTVTICLIIPPLSCPLPAAESSTKPLALGRVPVHYAEIREECDKVTAQCSFGENAFCRYTTADSCRCALGFFDFGPSIRAVVPVPLPVRASVHKQIPWVKARYFQYYSEDVGYDERRANEGKSYKHYAPVSGKGNYRG